MTPSETQALLKTEDLTLLQYVVLEACYNEPQSMSDLAALAGHSTPACTGMTDRLQARELIVRKHDVKDRRKIFVTVSTKGRELVERLKRVTA